jgi:hypothetical protein
MDFYTDCYIPSLNKEISLNKITFGDYFQLNSYIQNSDYFAINDTFNKICEKSCEKYKKLNNLDKFIILIHLKDIFLDPILKLKAKNENKEEITYEVLLKNIIVNSKKYKINNINLPKNLYYKNANDILKETDLKIKDIKNHIDTNKILMFEVPEMIKGVPKIYFNCFDNTLFYFSKLLYSNNLLNLYKKIAILKKNFNFLLSEIYDMSPKELDIFLNTK